MYLSVQSLAHIASLIYVRQDEFLRHVIGPVIRCPVNPCRPPKRSAFARLRNARIRTASHVSSTTTAKPPSLRRHRMPSLSDGEFSGPAIASACIAAISAALLQSVWSSFPPTELWLSAVDSMPSLRLSPLSRGCLVSPSA